MHRGITQIPLLEGKIWAEKQINGQKWVVLPLQPKMAKMRICKISSTHSSIQAMSCSIERQNRQQSLKALWKALIWAHNLSLRSLYRFAWKRYYGRNVTREHSKWSRKITPHCTGVPLQVKEGLLWLQWWEMLWGHWRTKAHDCLL